MSFDTAAWVGFGVMIVTLPMVITPLAVRRLARRFATETTETEVLGYEVESYETDRQVTLAVFAAVVFLTTWLSLWIGLGTVLLHVGLLP